MNEMIQAKDVRFRYDPESPVYAVDGASLAVRRGEFVARNIPGSKHQPLFESGAEYFR